MSFRLPILACGFALAACATSPDVTKDEGPTASVSSPVVVGSESPLARASVRVIATSSGAQAEQGCTGTLVTAKHVIVAAHCNYHIEIAAGRTVVVEFFDGPQPSGITRKVTKVDLRPGVSPPDLDDVNGKFADFAILTLETWAPSFSEPARLPVSYPGNNEWGHSVFWTSEPDLASLALKAEPAKTYSSNTNDGHFLIEQTHYAVDLQLFGLQGYDGTGAMYTYDIDGNLVVHGVRHGMIWEWGNRDKYTSFFHHIAWILQKMDYAGGLMTHANRMRIANLSHAPFTAASWRVCSLACAYEPACRAFNYIGSFCHLLATPGTLTGPDYPGLMTGAKWSL